MRRSQLGYPGVTSELGRDDSRSMYFDDAHHSVVFVVEDVAVVDSAAGEGVERYPYSGPALGRQVDHVLPGGWVDGLVAVFDDLHGPDVQVTFLDELRGGPA